MNAPDIFGLEYKIGTQRYVLSQHELRCIDSAKAKNNFSLPLNQVDPFYRYGGSVSPLYVLCFMYIGLGVIARGLQWLFGSAALDNVGLAQLLFFSSLIVFASFQIYRFIGQSTAYEFGYLLDNGVAFKLPTNKKNKEKAQAFVQTIVDRIHKSMPSNEQVFFLLCQYGLLTQAESTQLDAYIQQDQQTVKPHKNVVYLAN